MATVWELDFYSRPILDERQKKLWEVVICESPLSLTRSPESLFRYSQFCPSTTVNSVWLKQAIEDAIAEAGVAPQKIRFFRRQMNNMITKACEDIGIPPAPSRRTYTLHRWLEERMKDFYPTQEGFDETLAQTRSVQYLELSPIFLPDAIKGDRGDQWALVSLEASAFQDMTEWDIGFGESFPLDPLGLAPNTRIPGLILFSPRALPFAAWLSGLELGYLKFSEQPNPLIRLETGASDSWIIANINTPDTLAEAKGFEQTKTTAQNVHFLAIQSGPNSESFAGFWLLQELDGLK
ncbi:MAG: Tab2/Atab2 family RNA-binding protein [Snowella sp.]|nr:Tab2/Atab2 family RNA-binding protein [Snowella sp.]